MIPRMSIYRTHKLAFKKQGGFTSMSLNIALVDKSEIIKKMMSHCLRYYAAEIHRFETLDDLKLQSKHLKPDIIFIDWDLKKGDEPLAISAKKEITDIPLVVIYRNGSDEKITSITNRIKKPLDANLLRKMVADLVPELGQSKIHNFLKFPNKQQTVEEIEEQEKENTKKKPSKESVIDFDSNLDSSKKEDVSIQSKMRDYLDEVYVKKEITKTDHPMGLNLPKETENDLLVKGGEDQTTFKPTKPLLSDIVPKKKAAQAKKKSLFDKDEDNTFNDFAPMAIKSSSEEKTNPTYVPQGDKQNIQIKDEMILKVLEEYKNTLEFENLMELSLKQYAKDLSKKILEKDGGGEILKKSLSDFKKEDSFKQLILKTLSEYIKENSEFRSLFEKELQQFIIKGLPQLAKEIIEKEIKRILEEKS